ncbi:MAG TPA: FHA domain-containing protein [Blastocatellia bacterium]|nr:FHA domain-containing protein [Blastocatellia bacterium]
MPAEERAVRHDATQVDMAVISSAGPSAQRAPTLDRCAKCGATLPAGSSFCFKCGEAASIARTVVMTSAPKAPEPKGRLVLIMEGDQRGEAYDLKAETLIGRSSGQITFPHDEFMSGRHAKVVKKNNKFVLTDEGSRNGTFIRITGEVELKPGDTILIGKQLFRLELS